MKKTIFSLLLTLGFSPLLHAQWTSGGGVSYTNDRVGIGTATPGTTLYLQNAAANYASTLTLKNTSNNNASRAGLTMENSAGYQTIFYKQAPGNTDANDAILYSEQGDTRIYTAGLERLRIGNNGNIGIGTAAPQANIEINNNSYTNGNQLIVSGSEPTRYYGVIGTTIPSGHTVLSFGVKSNYTNYFQTLNLVDDNVSIGTTDPKGYKLAVNGSVIATSMTVKVYANWPDYVFKKDYQLPSLQSVKTYIDQNQHLPEVPSEQEIAKNGLNLGEMNKLLMKKVEELTLYLIEKDKKDTEQNTKISLQNKQANEQAKRIEELESQVKFLMKKLNN